MSSDGPDGEDLAVRQQVGERVLLLVDLGGDDAGEQGPGVGRRVVDLGGVGPVVGVGGVAADRDVPAVGELGERRVPARQVHVRDPRPRVGGRVEDVGVDDADVPGGATAVAADDEHPAVRQRARCRRRRCCRCVDRRVGARRPGPRRTSAAGAASRPRTGCLPLFSSDVVDRRRSARSAARPTGRRAARSGVTALDGRRRGPGADGVGRGDGERVGGAVGQPGDRAMVAGGEPVTVVGGCAVAPTYGVTV